MPAPSPIRTRLVAMLERTIVNCRDIITALEQNNTDEAIAKLHVIADRLRDTARELSGDRS